MRKKYFEIINYNGTILNCKMQLNATNIINWNF